MTGPFMNWEITMTRTHGPGWALNLILAGSLAGCSATGADSSKRAGPQTGVPTAAVGGGIATGSAATHPSGAAGTTPIGTGNVPVATAGRSAPPLGTATSPIASAGSNAPPPAVTPPATTPPAAAGAPSVPKAPHDTKTCLQAGSGDYTMGPYKVATMEVDLGMIEASQHTGKFTIYYPNPLEKSCLHPIVAWGNGTGVQGTGVYAFLNNNAASWGVVVAEAEEDNTGSGAFHKAGIDYLLKQNADPSSMFYQKLSTRAGVSGHSQGGFGASSGASHPNVETVAIEGATDVATDKFSVLILTGTKDIVMNAEALVTNAKGPMFVADWEGGDHTSTETVSGFLSGDKGSTQFSRLYAAWFRCQLADDPVACKMFAGGAPANCGICKDMGWHALASNNL
jgi:hypothetical protein